ncbi:hypothetical protein [Bartonella sp. CB169]|uniref:hypothetical protein n=1 Tax=Bartonella sp. CB169 TaxID=3112257 RepID=UPI00300DE2C1
MLLQWQLNRGKILSGGPAIEFYVVGKTVKGALIDDRMAHRVAFFFTLSGGRRLIFTFMKL